MSLTALAVICGLAGSAAYAQDAAPPQKTVRFGWQAATSTSTFWIGFDQKTFQAQGLKLELASFNDNAPELEAVVARQVDMAAVAPAPSLQAISFGALHRLHDMRKTIGVMAGTQAEAYRLETSAELKYPVSSFRRLRNSCGAGHRRSRSGQPRVWMPLDRQLDMRGQPQTRPSPFIYRFIVLLPRLRAPDLHRLKFVHLFRSKLAINRRDAAIFVHQGQTVYFD
jgi:hypothetical protein